MQAIASNRPNSFRSLLIVVILGAALIVAMLGGYVVVNRPGNPAATSTSVSPHASGQGAPLHGHFGGFE